jgi:hypothetical protein
LKSAPFYRSPASQFGSDEIWTKIFKAQKFDIRLNISNKKNHNWVHLESSKYFFKGVSDIYANLSILLSLVYSLKKYWISTWYCDPTKIHKCNRLHILSINYALVYKMIKQASVVLELFSFPLSSTLLNQIWMRYELFPREKNFFLHFSMKH